VGIGNRSEWAQFAESAWSAAGRPEGLQPMLVERDPVRYDEAFYEFFERRYFDQWLALQRLVDPEIGSLIQSESAAFRAVWQRHFAWEPIWKQVLPLFAFGGALGVNIGSLTQCAANYALAQAVPSMIVDRALDEGAGPLISVDAAACMLALVKGLAGLRSLQGRHAADIEDRLLGLVRDMYALMLGEQETRYQLPGPPLSVSINAYLGPASRLNSSVFFGVLPAWAYALADRPVPPAMQEAFSLLRRVRQLNDEVADVDEDLARGLVTLPWLYAMEEAPALRARITELWQRPNDAAARQACLDLLHATQGCDLALDESLRWLTRSMDAVREHLRPADSFEVTALLNVRWAHALRMRRSGFQPHASPRQPRPPGARLAGRLDTVIPVAGAGAVVHDGAGRTLMALVLKRGLIRWELPAGVAKDGESMEQTARRETGEETAQRVDIGPSLAVCWHHSRQLGKGWMGVFFEATLAPDADAPRGFAVIEPCSLGYSRINLGNHRDLYRTVDVDDYDFGWVRALTASEGLRPTAHEGILGAGFVDWTRIPEGRIHPLHLRLLQDQRLGREIGLLEADADADRAHYDATASLYLSRGGRR
jgi:8-oxo-dGTP pyrophosphatase MutT (NUDIX family)